MYVLAVRVVLGGEPAVGSDVRPLRRKRRRGPGAVSAMASRARAESAGELAAPLLGGTDGSCGRPHGCVCARCGDGCVKMQSYVNPQLV